MSSTPACVPSWLSCASVRAVWCVAAVAMESPSTWALPVLLPTDRSVRAIPWCDGRRKVSTAVDNLRASPGTPVDNRGGFAEEPVGAVPGGRA
ncbi:hypothetical protein GCM10022232_24910 [Streptomyces plumbiresistens]|uniref:Secreted protein n=1 Tax=Streptomyces plumbiresistens TaxID=511811 RepID=A0ABP7QYL8_9ACTN